MVHIGDLNDLIVLKRCCCILLVQTVELLLELHVNMLISIANLACLGTILDYTLSRRKLLAVSSCVVLLREGLLHGLNEVKVGI